MTSNVFTKKDILQQLASRGYFIDIYTLDAFFVKKKIEAIFEDSQGTEFYDKNALDVVLEELFNSKNQAAAILSDAKPKEEQVKNESSEPELKINDNETLDILNNISLSDGTPLIDKVGDVKSSIIEENITAQENESAPDIQIEPEIKQETQQTIEPLPIQEEQNIQELSYNTDGFFNSEQTNDSNIKDDMFEVPKDELSLPNSSDTSSYDDITLLSESLEAQEKLRQYVMSELSKNNLDVNPQQKMNVGNEFKLDISERTLNMIARTMARKIAKYVGSIMAADAKQSSKVAEYQEENRRLTQKARELEEQNRKLRLLLAESNKNLNSYKPSFFGLYKKIDPKKNKK